MTLPWWVRFAGKSINFFFSWPYLLCPTLAYFLKKQAITTSGVKVPKVTAGETDDACATYFFD
ncbi:MAG: hypothetical protein V2B19_30660 [Pseudomonadota bacterium]